MRRMLCSHENCPVTQNVGVLYHNDNRNRYWYCREHRGATEFEPKRIIDKHDYYKCPVCEKDILFHEKYDYFYGHRHHCACIIQKMRTKVGAPDLKPLRSALREYTRIFNYMALHRPLTNDWYGTPQNKNSSMYKGQVGMTWAKVKAIALKSVKDAIKELEKS